LLNFNDDSNAYISNVGLFLDTSIWDIKKYISKWLIIMYGIGLDVVTLHCDADPHCFIMARKEHPPYHVSEQRPTDE
jgi:hypothetical protein